MIRDNLATILSIIFDIHRYLNHHRRRSWTTTEDARGPNQSSVFAQLLASKSARAATTKAIIGSVSSG